MTKIKETKLIVIEEPLLFIEEPLPDLVPEPEYIFDSMVVDTDDDPSHVPDKSLEFVVIAPAKDYWHMYGMLLAWSPKVKAGGYVCGVGYNVPHVKQALHNAYGSHHKFVDIPSDDRWTKDV